MYLRCSETFLSSFALDELLNRLVAEVCEKRPVSSRQMLELMREALETQKMQKWYFAETVRCFNEAVNMLSRRGFSLQMTCPLYFRIPQEDGGVDELFRYGSEIAVTPNNYDNFECMLRHYQAMVNHKLSRDGYCAAARRFLPISAQRNLLNPSYTPILNFIQECLLNAHSPWAIQTSAMWDELGVTYAVPFAGRLFAVDPSKSVMALVPFEEANRYVELASERCRTLSNLITTGASLNVVRRTSATVPGPSLSTAFSPDESTKPATSMLTAPAAPQGAAAVAVAIPATTTSEEEATQWDAFATIGLRRELFPEMTPAEVEFWRYILLLRQSPSPIHNISFHLEFGRHKMDLKENGRFIPVTRLNLNQFIEAVVARQDYVHAYINEVASGSPTCSSTSQNKEKENGDPEKEPGAAPAKGEAATFTHSTPSPHHGGKLIVKPPPRLAVSVKPSTGHGERESQRFNEVRLTLQDMNSTVVRSILELRSQHHSGRLTKTELNARQLRFCLPCREGVYNLISNGRFIQVVSGNVGHFFDLVEGEKRRLEVIAASINETAELRQELPFPSALTTSSGVTGPPNIAHPEHWHDSSAVDTPSQDEGFWTDRNVLDIWTYECTTDCLLKSSMSPDEIVRQTQLQWDTNFLSGKDCPYNHDTGDGGGRNILPKDVKMYLRLLRRRLQTVRLAVLDAGRYPQQPSEQDTTEWDVANPNFPATSFPHPAPPPPNVPLSSHPMQDELNMFSPTHTTGNLLAPP